MYDIYMYIIFTYIYYKNYLYYIYIYIIYIYILYIYIYIYNKQIFYINIKKWLGENVYESDNQMLPLS